MTTQREQRRTQRKTVILHASVTEMLTGKSMPVRTINLSKRGARIEADEAIAPESVCTFKLVTDDARAIELQGRIAWVKPQEEGKCQAGVSFRNLSVDEEYMLDLQIIRSEKKQTRN